MRPLTASSMSSVCAPAHLRCTSPTQSPDNPSFFCVIQFTTWQTSTTTSNQEKHLNVLLWQTTCRTVAAQSSLTLQGCMSWSWQYLWRKLTAWDHQRSNPRALNKTTTKLALSVFCESTRDALHLYYTHDSVVVLGLGLELKSLVLADRSLAFQRMRFVRLMTGTVLKHFHWN